MADPNEFQHYERLDMERDYEGGQWVGGEFFYSKKRKKQTQSKDDQIYGVFADDSDSDGDRRGRRRDRGDRDGERDYTKPVGFVSSGKVVQDTMKQDEEEDGTAGATFGPAQRPGSEGLHGVEGAEGDEEAEGRPSFGGLGLGARGGLGSGGSGGGGGEGGRGGLGSGGGGGGAGARGGLGSGGGGGGEGGRGGLGSGGGGGGDGGLGFKPAGSRDGGGGGGGDEEDEEEAVMPSAFGKRHPHANLDGTLPPQPAAYGAPYGSEAGGYATAAAAAAGVAAAAASAAAASIASRDLTLRDLVMRFAEEHGVEFQPKGGRSHEGLPVYGFGAVSVVLDNTSGVVRAQLGPRWAPMSLDQLLALVVARTGK
ncbi:hypothetical protein TSOC_012032 [Tetrabaena socialis]|uniref:Tuftelin interacting protein N-terminal domain-containing protein n=1 Tax=Tetrabaena socialis TaxID=47790 RepID=A0A2J7ZP32_9CHLO|nr:hypothetical protein TSOC_012032 [Tetrabaena socialis]|eukprot:PNH02018.1 hypothetical protein TSOC_012032 [Tetrabaena socialis]